MQITASLALLTALVSSAHAAVARPYYQDFQDPFSVSTNTLGTFDIFTDTQCSQGGAGITVSSDQTSGILPPNVMSVKAYMPPQSSCTCKITIKV